MALTFDPAARRIVLDSATTTATEIYSRWADWAASADNAKYLPAFRSLGGDDLGGGLLVPPYYFLLNGWRVRPMEADQTLTIDGNLFVDGGGEPVVQTLGTYRVLTRLVVPVQAQGFDTSGGGGGSGPSAGEIAAAVWAYATRNLTGEQATQLQELHRIHGLESGVPLVVTPTERTAGAITQNVSEAGDTVTVERA